MNYQNDHLVSNKGYAKIHGMRFSFLRRDYTVFYCGMVSFACFGRYPLKLSFMTSFLALEF
jgi:hypothetical protein